MQPKVAKRGRPKSETTNQPAGEQTQLSSVPSQPDPSDGTGQKQKKRTCTENKKPSQRLNAGAQNEDATNEPGKLPDRDVSELEPSPKEAVHHEETGRPGITPCNVWLSSTDSEEEKKISEQVRTLQSEIVTESSEEPELPKTKKPPTRRRAKLCVKPSQRPSVSKRVQMQPKQLALPTRCSGSRTKVQRESEQTITDSESKGGATMPGLPLSAPSSSTTRVASSASQTTIRAQLEKPPVIAQPGSPSGSEISDDDPSRVSQFIICDIFTEVDDVE